MARNIVFVHPQVLRTFFHALQDSYWSNWLEWCRRHRVVVDKEAWHAVVRAAKKAAPKRVKPLVHHLFDFEQAERDTEIGIGIGGGRVEH